MIAARRGSDGGHGSVLLLLCVLAASLGAALAKDTAFVEVVLFESSPNGDYTTYTTGLQGRFSKAGATISAEGEIVQVGANSWLRSARRAHALSHHAALLQTFSTRVRGVDNSAGVCVCVCVSRPRARARVRGWLTRSQQDGSYLVEFIHGGNVLPQVILLTSGARN